MSTDHLSLENAGLNTQTLDVSRSCPRCFRPTSVLASLPHEHSRGVVHSSHSAQFAGFLTGSKTSALTWLVLLHALRRLMLTL